MSSLLRGRGTGEGGDQHTTTTSGSAVQVYVCAPPNESRLFVQTLYPGNPRGVVVASYSDDASLVEKAIEEFDVTVVVISPQARNYSDQLVARVSRRPDLIVVVGLVPAAGDWARQLDTSGALGILTTPVTEKTIDTFVASVPGWMSEAAKQRQSGGFMPALDPHLAQAVSAMGFRAGVWTAWSPKGGVGKTTTAVNLGALLGVVAQRKTLLLDANMNGGHIDLHLGVETDTNIASLARLYEQTHQLTPSHIKEYAIPWGSGTALDVIAGIQRVEQAGVSALMKEQGEDFIETLLRVAGRMYDFVVVDLGSSVNNVIHRTVLANSDGVVVVTTPDRTALINIRDTLKVLEDVMGFERSRYTLVVNMWSDAGITRGEITRFVGLAEAGMVPLETTGAVTFAANSGKPFVLANLNSKDPATQQVVKAWAAIATEVYPPLQHIMDAKGHVQQQKKKSGGLLSRVLG